MVTAMRGHERAAAPHDLLLGYLGRAAFKNVKRFRMCLYSIEAEHNSHGKLSTARIEN